MSLTCTGFYSSVPNLFLQCLPFYCSSRSQGGFVSPDMLSQKRCLRVRWAHFMCLACKVQFRGLQKTCFFFSFVMSLMYPLPHLWIFTNLKDKQSTGRTHLEVRTCLNFCFTIFLDKDAECLERNHFSEGPDEQFMKYQHLQCLSLVLSLTGCVHMCCYGNLVTAP